MGKGKGGVDDFKKPGGIMKILEFALALGAFIAIMIGSGSWRGDTVILFNVTCLIGFIYALVIILCMVFDLADAAKWDTGVCICISILSFIAASIYSLTFEIISHSNSKQAICYQAATILEFLAAFAYLIDALLVVMDIGGK